MKHLSVITLLLFAITCTSFGQMTGGLKAGANLSTIMVTKSGEDLADESYSARFSFHAGSYAQASLNDYLLWRIELLFSNKGYKKEINDETINVSLNYLNWPVLLIYRPIKVLEIEFGPEFGYMISGEEMMSSFDLGIDVGARYNISNKLNAGLRYSYGIPFNMEGKGTDAEGYSATYQNSVFQFYIGFNLINETKEKQ
jgi:hypothetical protein